jgi:hypothetical protein
MKSSIEYALNLLKNNDKRYLHVTLSAKLKYCPYGQCEAYFIGNMVILRSYQTLVAFYDKDSKQFFINDLYSTTTRRHINAFLLEYAGIHSFVPYKPYIGKALINCINNEIEEIKGED